MALTIYLSLIFLVVYLIGLGVRRWIFIRDRNRMAVESRGGSRVVARVDEVAARRRQKILADLSEVPP